MALDLGKQVGPLPLGAWIAVVGTGVGFALFAQRGPSSSEPEIVEDVGGVPGVGTGPGWVAVPPPSFAPTAPAIETNDDWARQATNWLIAQGYDAGVSDLAVRKYVNGDDLSIQEYALIRIALTKFGALPYGIPVALKPPEIEPVTPATPVAQAPLPTPTAPPPVVIPAPFKPPAYRVPKIPSRPRRSEPIYTKPRPVTRPARGILTPSPTKPRPKVTFLPDGTFSLFPVKPTLGAYTINEKGQRVYHSVRRRR
jgi:hypothetical protein